MAYRAVKEKEVVVVDKCLKPLRKGTEGLKSLATKAPPARRFEAKDVEEHGL
ncbi:hypothetical protein HAX54_000925, partial [Datura stramonium]|nr:hypothetical protein [Datura stramonium]